MTLSRRFLVCALVLGAFSVAAASAPARTLAGGTCTASGSGTSFTLTVNIPAGEPTQGGFAIGAPGVTVVIIVIHDHPGSMSTNGLPPGTSNELLLNSNPLIPGAIYNVDVTTSGPFSGPFNVVPTNFPPTSYFSPFSCPFLAGPGSPPPAEPSNIFGADPGTFYNPATKTWEKSVAIPGPGVLLFGESPGPRLLSLASAASATAATPLIRSGRVVATHAGKVKLILRPTAAGKAVLKQKGVLKIRLKITFTPTGGKPASKTLSLTLRAKK